MRRTPVWAVIALLIAGMAGVAGVPQKRLAGGPPAAPPAADKTDPKVAQLIAELGSEDYRTREKAGAGLETVGEKALPAMRAALLAAESPEVRQRLAVLVRKMDVARLVAPKRINLVVKQKSVKQTLDELAKQSGYKIEFNGNNSGDEKHDFEFEDTPFWLAVDKVAAAAGYSVVSDYDDETVRVQNQEASNPYVAYAGPFRFIATQIYSNKSVQLSNLNRRGGGNYRSESMTFSFQIQSEPKNPMLGVTPAEVVSATDENGASLVAPKDPNNRSNYYDGRGGMRGHTTYGNLNLSRNGGNSATLKSLKAKVGIILLSGTAPEIVVNDPLKVKSKSYVGRTVEMDFGSLAEDPANKGQYTLDVTLKKHGAQEGEQRFDYNWSNNIWSKIELLDADGNKYSSYGPNNINNNGFTVQITVPYSQNDRRTGQKLKLGPPAKLVVNEWLSVTHEVTFEFKDLPLP